MDTPNNPASTDSDELASLRKRVAELEAAEGNGQRGALLKWVFENSLVPIVLMDPETFQCVDANQAAVEVCGLASREQILGTTPLDFSPPTQYDGTQSPEGVRSIVKKALAEKKVVFEWRQQRPNGEIWDAEVSVMPFQLGPKTLIQVTVNDITERRREKEELKLSVSLLRATLEATADGILVVDDKGQIVDFNDRFVQLWQFPADFFPAVRNHARRDPGSDQRAIDFVLAQLKDADAFVSKVRQLYSTPLATSFDILEFKDGRVFERWSMPHCIDGQPVGRVWSFRDVSDRKKAEEALRTSEEHFRRTFDLSPVGAVIVGSDFQFLRCNKAFCQFIGYGESELHQKTFPEVTYPDDRRVGVAEARAILAGKLESARLQKRYLHRDGRPVWGEVSIRMVRNSAGDPLHFLTVILDITEQKRSEEALRASEEHYRLLIRSINDAVFVCRPDATGTASHFLEVNDIACRQLGYTREELLQMSPVDIREPESLRVYRQVVLPQLMAKHHAVWEEVHIHKDGHQIPVEISANRFEHDGRPIAIATVRDISERKQFEKRMQQTQKLESLGVLAGGIAHDFNNMLTAILGHANLALVDLPPESPARDALREIENTSVRAAELCRQMLAYAGRGRFIVEPINLSHLIEELAHLLHVSISKKVLLRRQLAEALPTIEADPAQLRQVAMNLIINAAEAIGDNEGVIAISTGVMQCSEDYLRGSHPIEPAAPGPYVFLEVADTGCGMDAETRDRIFDPFFTTKFAGRGLGLAAVLGIVRSHHGMLKVESERSRGTTFRVFFPAASKAAVPLERVKDPPPWRGSGTILLVDDEEPVRIVTGRMLEHSGFKVLRASDGLEALELFRAHASEIDCVLLDLAMPRMDGEETFRELRRIRPGVRVVLASGYGDQEIAQRFRSAGLSGLIEKPFRTEELCAKLREVLAPRGQTP
jgi:PAS domain S-box-containing protein